MSQTQKRRAQLTALLCLCAGFYMLPRDLSAESTPRAIQLRIPAQPLNLALLQFTRSTGFQLVYSTEAVKGMTSRPLDGTYAPRAALVALLRGLDVTIVDTGIDAATLKLSGGLTR